MYRRGEDSATFGPNHDYSGLIIMYAVFQQFDPSVDLSADFSAKHAMAVKAAKGD